MKEEGSALDARTIGVREQKERANNKIVVRVWSLELRLWRDCR